MTAVLTSFRASLGILLGARAAGAIVGLGLGTMWRYQANHTAHAAPTAMALLAANLKGTAMVALLSGATGGLAGIAFNLVDGARYGIAISGGVVAAPPHGPLAQAAATVFPWLEFVAVSAAAAATSVVFWRLWFNRTPLIAGRHLAAVAAVVAVCLVAAAELEALLLQ